jgi:hypothetical protein
MKPATPGGVGWQLTCGGQPGWQRSWAEGMHPEIPETKVLSNPYTYRDKAARDTRDESEPRS